MFEVAYITAVVDQNILNEETDVLLLWAWICVLYAGRTLQLGKRLWAIYKTSTATEQLEVGSGSLCEHSSFLECQIQHSLVPLIVNSQL